MSNLKTADLFGLDNRGKSRNCNAYEVTLAGGERKRNVFAPTRKDAIHQAWWEIDPELGGNNWDEIEIKQRRK